jgi:hypothetical protein
MFNSQIETAQRESIQENIVGSPIDSRILYWLASGTGVVSPWWSAARDIDLRAFWKKEDHLAGAIYALESKMTAVPFRVIARDQGIKAHTKQAEMLTESLYQVSEYGEGWISLYGKWVQDLLVCDNGAFMEVIGYGDPVGPIIGTPIGLAHLDSGRCTRTGDKKFPVIYQDTSGKFYKMHYTRVIFASQMSSTRKDMNGVGYSAVSRCINIAQTMLDILIYKQEKMGSRPPRQLAVGKGVTANEIATAFAIEIGRAHV